jgi:hypothetical protein
MGEIARAMSHSNQPPGLPEIVDEAGDTPNWVPLVGLALVVMVALLIAVRQATGGGEADQPAGAAGADAGTAQAAPGAAEGEQPGAAQQPAPTPSVATGRPAE